MGARYSDKDIQLKLPAWTFPSGAKYAFGHCQNEVDKYNYQGKEFHYIGFDQVEEFTESQFLFLMAQNRTSDKNIKCYIRCTANPGGVGHAWVKKRYIDTLKPHEKKFFKRVEDDDVEVLEGDQAGISRSFIPASVYDNPSIIQNDPQYIRRLEQLPEAEKQALLHGNWEVFAGQFFKMWRRYLHVQTKRIEPTFRKFASLDYGFGAPSCVLWWQVGFDGTLHAYRELYKEGLTYEALAKAIMENTPHDEKLDYVVADPAIWGDKTHHREGVQGESGAETMGRVFKTFSTLVRADNSRITGWGRMRILLEPDKDGQVSLTFSPLCRNAIRTIPTLIHSESLVEDLDTDGEDHCFDKETVVRTKLGKKRLSDLIGENGFVLSHDGKWHEFDNCRLTRKSKETVKLTFSDGHSVISTKDHRFMLSDGSWGCAIGMTDAFCYTIMYNREEMLWKLKESVINVRNSAVSVIISVVSTIRTMVSDFIGSSGRTLTAIYHRAITSIMPTMTVQTTIYQTSDYSTAQNIYQDTSLHQSEKNKAENISTESDTWPLSGTEVNKAVSGIKSTMRNLKTNSTWSLIWSAFSATRISRQSNTQSSAQINASRLSDGNKALTILMSYVSYVRNLLERTAIQSKHAVREFVAVLSALINGVACRNLSVVSVVDAGLRDVYCLTVKDTGNFSLENGVVVSNCADSARYGAMSRPITPQAPKESIRVRSISWFEKLERGLGGRRSREAWEPVSKI